MTALHACVLDECDAGWFYIFQDKFIFSPNGDL